MSQTEPSGPLVYLDAPTPFNDVGADVILRTSDNIDFRTFKSILSLASPFFRSMFNLPQPNIGGHDGAMVGGLTGEIKDGLPVITLTEPSEVIELMLTFCYPVRNPVLDTLEETVQLWETARKYDMEELIQWVGERLVDQRFLEEEPARAYVMACRHKVVPLAKAAARWTLQYPITKLFEHFDDLQGITADEYLPLLRYHRRCSDDVSLLASRPGSKWTIRTNYVFFSRLCTTCPKYSGSVFVSRKSRLVPQWWMDYMESTGEALAIMPCSSVCKGVTLRKALEIARDCQHCSQSVMDMKLFSDELKEEIDRVVSKVELEILF
ncbi:hypothetical protein JAAARDRAFT_150224 [Jaapia argillacea MUCL 33604]|uniref:BTB domain-containing protein n=1 Tax=Jaapia argillacea MUCL 33604 TaxID=933084 RepID=A0A067Q3F5_9AGAM|nr:hypothetical protein JAAARDRAFT_150224 [Jaapia argillacea MUCL 33604]